MRSFSLSADAYRRITLIVLVAVAVIIVSGAAVRLTGSGLGCPDWPTCVKSRVVTPQAFHKTVELTNRQFTGVVSVGVIVAVLGSLARRPRRRDLVILSSGLVAGVIGQIVLGGLTVLFKLRPPFVMAHFILSMAILADAVVLHHRAGQPEGRPRPVVSREVLLMGRLMLAAAAIVIFIGTAVTGAGPHGGDKNVERLPLLVPDVARAHGIGVFVFLALTLVTLWRLQREGGSREMFRRGEVLLVVLVAQGAVGYTQYFTGVPVLLVGIHVAGAAAVWVATIRFVLSLSSTQPAPALRS